MADGKEQYIFSFAPVPPGTPDSEVVSTFIGRAKSPAPTIVVKQDQELYLSLSNVGMIMHPDLFDAHSVHWHGFVNAASVFDGVPEVSPAAAMQATQPYYYLRGQRRHIFLPLPRGGQRTHADGHDRQPVGHSAAERSG